MKRDKKSALAQRRFKGLEISGVFSVSAYLIAELDTRTFPLSQCAFGDPKLKI